METLIELSSYSKAMQLHNKSPWECEAVLMTLQKNIHWSETLPVLNQRVSVRTEDVWNVWQKHGYLKKQSESIVSYVIFNLLQPLLVKKRGKKSPRASENINLLWNLPVTHSKAKTCSIFGWVFFEHQGADYCEMILGFSH